MAGMGTRFLPATKANPKEMLPIVDKPLIQYAVEEAVAAGIEELIFVTSSAKRAIEDHFDSNFELETNLANKGKNELLKIVREVLPEGVNCCYVRQKVQLGLGHAVLCAKQVVGDEPFAVLLADDLIDSTPGCLSQMVAVHQQTQSSVVAVETIEPQDSTKYGIVAIDQSGVNGAENTTPSKKMINIVEKPEPSQAPSNLAVVGRYILTPKIFELLEQTAIGAGGEIQLTDAIANLLQHEPVEALPFSGHRYDCGSKLGYLDATVNYGLKHPEIGKQFKKLMCDKYELVCEEQKFS